MIMRFLIGLLAGAFPCLAATFTVASYNLNNYLDQPIGSRPAKSEAGRAKIREGLLAIKPDVLALQEIGGEKALRELRNSLRADGLEYPHWEHVRGFDTNIQVAVLSRFPIVARRPHTNENYLLHGRRFHSSRGFAEVDIAVNSRYQFTLITAHLKSKRQVPEADEAELRQQEARLLRGKVEARLASNPNANVVLLGDFNDTKDSPSLKLLVGKGPSALYDTRPAERNGDTAPPPAPFMSAPRVTWTYFYGKEDTYSRVDYILLSRGMAREWQRSGTYVLAFANWGIASDHRPIVATFEARER
ncbi:MAG TPA: endonuclease/exonuclease/phosphatase family protein [Candidatus Paceibacterota bacterium]|nr:endonuclease/exonuclease/phosphatase family protein [Verrucomicrobiota bacterium]HRY48849.1 endonuclease/exonuclease/phosphatase family protein [Candidatus Paceibacterota bacterium]